MSEPPAKKRRRGPIPIEIEQHTGKEVSLTLELGTSQAPVSFTLRAPAEEFSERLNALEIILPSLMQEILPQSQVDGGGEQVKFIAGNYSVLPSDSVVIVDTSTGNVSVNLPTATLTGKRLVIMKETVDDNSVSVVCFGNDLIQGLASKTLSSQWSKVVLESDGVSNWLDLGSGLV
jgi:hypothetical protein